MFQKQPTYSHPSNERESPPNLLNLRSVHSATDAHFLPFPLVCFPPNRLHYSLLQRQSTMQLLFINHLHGKVLAHVTPPSFQNFSPSHFLASTIVTLGWSILGASSRVPKGTHWHASSQLKTGSVFNHL